MQKFLTQVKEWAGVVALVAILVPYFGSMFAGPMLGYTSIANNPFRMPNSYADFGQGYYVDSAVVIDADGDLQIGGATGSTLNRINAGSCHLAVGSSSPLTIAATSTVYVDCQGTNVLASATASYTALTGVTSNDSIFVSPPTTTPVVTGSGSLEVTGVSASTTAGYIVIKIMNNTGGTFTFATTSVYDWRYWVVDDN